MQSTGFNHDLAMESIPSTAIATTLNILMEQPAGGMNLPPVSPSSMHPTHPEDCCIATPLLRLICYSCCHCQQHCIPYHLKEPDLLASCCIMTLLPLCLPSTASLGAG